MPAMPSHDVQKASSYLLHATQETKHQHVNKVVNCNYHVMIVTFITVQSDISSLIANST